MAGRVSFQKRQKEAARKEKRQLKLDRRQGRAMPGQSLGGDNSNEETENDEFIDDELFPAESSADPLRVPAKQ
jgi:hypothetical protein